MNKIFSTMELFYYTKQLGYKEEPWLKRTNLVSPELFVITVSTSLENNTRNIPKMRFFYYILCLLILPPIVKIRGK